MSYLLPFVEVHLVHHCNHTCRWCHNYSPNSPKREYKAEDYFEGLDLLRANKVDLNSISLMGGEKNILPLFGLIRHYNPNLHIMWPDKFKFNELKFFAEPREERIYCGNSECLALVNLPDGPTLGRCAPAPCFGVTPPTPNS